MVGEGTHRFALDYFIDFLATDEEAICISHVSFDSSPFLLILGIDEHKFRA